MDLLNLLVKISVDDQASNQMQSVSAGMIAKAQLIASTVQSAITSAAGAIKGFVTEAVSSFSQFEQLKGGMETFFGDAASTVISNAQQAYQTAGMSANDYMQTTSNFAMSLIESVKKRRSEAVGSSTKEMVEALQSQYDATKKAYDDEYAAMQDNFQRQNKALQRALSDQLDAVKEAQQERVEAAQKAFEEEREALAKSQQEQVDEYQKATDESLEILDEQHERARSLLEDELDHELELLEEAQQKKLKLIDEEYTERLKLIDEEEYKRVKAINDQIQDLEDQNDAEREQLRQRERARREQSLRDAINNAKTAEAQRKAQQNLSDFLEKSAMEDREKQRKVAIEALKDRRDVIKQQAQEERDELKQQAKERTDELKQQFKDEKDLYTEQAKERRDLLKKQQKDERDDYVESRKQGLKDLQDAQQAEMKELTDSQQDKLRQLQKANSDELKEMQRANEDQLDEVQRGQKRQLDALKDAQNQRLDQLKDSIAKEKQALSSSTAEFIQTTTEDQQRAAELSDMAVKDMADNAAKMGTPIQMLQDAYRGFAMGNFTMLDNLKLGYSGTKTEMERLLTTAEQIKASHGEMAEYSVDSFADIVEAIHVVQQEYGITGTAAKEGSSTIQGALDRVHAAWENWLVSLADPDVDVEESTRALMVSVGDAASLIIPRVATILKTLFDYVNEHGPEIWEQFKQAMMDALPDEWKEKLQGIMDKLSEFMTHLPETIETVKNLAIAFAGLQVVGTIAGAFSNLSSVVGMATQGLGGLSGAAQAAAGGGGLAGVGTAAGSAAGEVGKLTGAAAEAAGTGGLGSLAGAASGAGGALTSALGPAAIAGGAMAGVGLLTNSVLESTGSVDRFRETVKNGTYDATAQFTHMSSSAVNNANTVNSSYGRMKQEIETATKKMSSDTDTGFRDMVNSISKSRERSESNVGSLKNNIVNIFSGAGSWLTVAGMNVMTGFWNGLQERFRDVQTWIGSIGQWVADHKGPKEYDLGLLVPNGRWIMQSFETGLRQGFPLIEGAISDLTDMVQRESQFDIGSSVSMSTQAVSVDQQGPQAGVRMFGQHDRSQVAQRDLNVILMLDKTELARAVYKLNADETQRVGVQLAGGYA